MYKGGVKMSLLEVKNLKKIYTTRFSNQQVQALSNVTFSVEEGEYVAIMGESGSGKTTLLNILASLDQPTSGQVLLNGQDITHLKEKEISQFRRKNLGFVFQDFNLLDTFSIKDNIFLPLVLSKEPYPVMQQKLKALAPKLGIEDLLEKYPYEISGGQKESLLQEHSLHILNLFWQMNLLVPLIQSQRINCWKFLIQSIRKGKQF